MKKLVLVAFILSVFLNTNAQVKAPLDLPYCYGFVRPNDTKQDYEKIVGDNYGYCDSLQISNLIAAIKSKNQAVDKEYQDKYNQFSSINDTLIALQQANDIDRLNKLIQFYTEQQKLVLEQSMKNVADIYYNSAHIVIISSPFSKKYSGAKLDSMGLFRAFEDGIRKYCNTTIEDTIVYTETGGVARNKSVYRSLNMVINGSGESAPEALAVNQPQRNCNFWFKVYNVQVYPFKEKISASSSQEKSMINTNMAVGDSIISFDVLSGDLQKVKDFLVKQEKKYYISPDDIQRVLSFCEDLIKAIPEKNKETVSIEKQRLNKIIADKNNYDKKISDLKDTVKEHKRKIKRIIMNQTENKCSYNENNLKQTLACAEKYFGARLDQIKSELIKLKQKRYCWEQVKFLSSGVGEEWYDIYQALKEGNKSNSFGEIEKRLATEFDLYKKITVKKKDGATTSEVTMTNKINYKGKISQYWLYPEWTPQNIRITFVGVCSFDEGDETPDNPDTDIIDGRHNSEIKGNEKLEQTVAINKEQSSIVDDNHSLSKFGNIFLIQVKEDIFGKKSTSFEEKLSSVLINNGYKIVKEEAKAGMSIIVEAVAAKLSERTTSNNNTAYSVRVKASVKITDKSGEVLFIPKENEKTSISTISPEAAAEKAYRELAEEVANEIIRKFE